MSSCQCMRIGRYRHPSPLRSIRPYRPPSPLRRRPPPPLRSCGPSQSCASCCARVGGSVRYILSTVLPLYVSTATAEAEHRLRRQEAALDQDRKLHRLRRREAAQDQDRAHYNQLAPQGPAHPPAPWPMAILRMGRGLAVSTSFLGMWTFSTPLSRCASMASVSTSAGRGVDEKMITITAQFSMDA